MRLPIPAKAAFMSFIRRVLKGYRSILSRLAGFVALLGLCVLAGFAVTWPAWKMAQASPKAFTAVFLICAAAIALFFLLKYVRAAWRASPSLFMIKAASRVIFLAGLILFVAQTLSRRVPLAFACLAAGMLAAGLVRFGLAGKEKGGRSPRKA